MKTTIFIAFTLIGSLPFDQLIPFMAIEILERIEAPADDLYHITKIVDGDTFYAEDEKGYRRKYRLIGMNTPEFSHFGRPEEPFAQEATDYLADLLKDRQVILKYDIQHQDKYNRELVYAYLPNGIFINAELIKAGWAQIMTIPPNVAHADDFVQLQSTARTEGKGIWE